jgi:hypothetical protein
VKREEDMNEQRTDVEPGQRVGVAYLAGIVGALLIVGALSWAMYNYMQPEPLGKNRAEERAKALAELQAAENDALHNVGWVDQTKGLVRLRIEDAMQMVERDWQNPPAARSNLIARAEKANPPPPPPAPSALE